MPTGTVTKQQTMKIKELIHVIHEEAPLFYQEDYDNSGLQVGNPENETEAALLTLDVTEATIEEAIRLNCQLIIAHHPVIFKSLKRLNGQNATERIIIKAIQQDIAIFAAHTNLDNMANGVNLKIAEKIGILNPKILSPLSHNILKLHTYVPASDCDPLLNQLYHVGAGAIGNYSECSFKATGLGTFRPNTLAHPVIGQPNGLKETVTEQRIEVIFPEERKKEVLATLFKHHPYEEVAYGIIRLENQDQTKGAGMIGQLEHPVPIEAFFETLKSKMQAKCIRHTAFLKDKIQKVALCGGSGSFLLQEAIRQGADLFLTADFKYHQFFDSDNQIVIADIGHYESEQFTTEIFSEIIKRKFPNFATHFTEVNTNPINYYF